MSGDDTTPSDPPVDPTVTQESAPSQPSSPRVRADRQLAEDFACRVVEVYGSTCCAGVCLPWSSGTRPAGTICPSSNDGTLDEAALQAAIRSKSVILMGCSFQHADEEAAAVKVFQRLGQLSNMCILVAHLLLPGEDHDAPGKSELVMRVHQRIHRLGADDVLLDPELQAGRLKLRIRMALHSWTVNRERLNAMLAEEPQPPPIAEVQAMEATQQRLLWEDIPRELMCRLKQMPSDWPETDSRVGEYILGPHLETQFGIVREGNDERERKIAVKITRKCDVFIPGDVEGIYREFRFLAGFTRHPNIPRGLACFHSQTNVYTVMEFLGRKNLAQHLATCDGLRMNREEATSCFSQISSAVNHLHEKDVSHRSISLEHVCMKPQAEGRAVPKLIDFRHALVAKEGVTSVTQHGKLPCMSPEMLMELPYLPKVTDCWSVGVLLLEMAGGMGSFLHALRLNERVFKCIHFSNDLGEKQQVANRILTHFGEPGSHRAALACMGGLHDADIQEILESLLDYDYNRGTLAQWCSGEDAISRQNSEEAPKD